MQRSKWVAWEDALLRKATTWDEQYSWHTVADRLGRSLASVVGRARLLGLERGLSTKLTPSGPASGSDTDPRLKLRSTRRMVD